MSPAMRSASNPLLLAALDYAKRGWPIFPLRPRGKQPITTNGFKAATQDHDLILAWWATNPDANVGIATGDAFDVLDIDGPEGKSAFLEYLKEQGAFPYVHPGPVSITGKGYHLLFTPTGRGNRAKLAEAPIDFRGKGGYIVAPPSVHPLGHCYRWDKAGHRTQTTPLPPAPAWLTTLLGQDKVALPEPPRAIVKHDPITGRPFTIVLAGGIADQRPDILIVADSLGLEYRVHEHYAMAKCPFHPDDTPSFAMYMAPQNKFYCHGCGAHGDSIDLSGKTDIEHRHFL